MPKRLPIPPLAPPTRGYRQVSKRAVPRTTRRTGRTALTTFRTGLLTTKKQTVFFSSRGRASACGVGTTNEQAKKAKAKTRIFGRILRLL
jgi:hypothetical protein